MTSSESQKEKKRGQGWKGTIRSNSWKLPKLVKRHKSTDSGSWPNPKQDTGMKLGYHSTYTGETISVTTDFSSETADVTKKWHSSAWLYNWKYSLGMNGKSRHLN